MLHLLAIFSASQELKVTIFARLDFPYVAQIHMTSKIQTLSAPLPTAAMSHIFYALITS